MNELVPIVGENHVTRGAPVLSHEFIEEALEAPDEYEFEVDTTPEMRQPLAILFKLRLEIMCHMGEGWGFRERFAKDVLQLCNEATILYENVVMVITTPIPFPYVNLCKVLLTMFLLSTPLITHPSLGFFGNVILPSIVTMSLCGIDAISSELENPFGDDLNDLDILGAIANLESECLTLLELSGDTLAGEAFTKYPWPEAMRSEDPRAPVDFIVLSSQVMDQTAVRQSQSQMEQEYIKPAIKKQSNKKRDSAENLHASICEDSDEEKSVRKPLLARQSDSIMGSAIGFVVMEEFGTETINLEEDRTVAAARGKDVEGLSDDEEESSRSPAQARGSPASLDMPQDAMSSQIGFVPMKEFETETIDLEGDGGGSKQPDMADNVGLDSDSDLEAREEADEEPTQFVAMGSSLA